MRFILALVSLLIAVVLIGYGIAQRTVLAGPDQITAVSEASSDATVTVIDGETLNARPGLQDVRVDGDAIFAAYGRTTDVLAWVGDATYNNLTFDDETLQLTDEVVVGTEDEVPSPVDSDLWLKQYTGEGELRMPVKLDPDLSFILVSDGTEPAPAQVSITWPLDNRTPWAGPLVAGGAAMLLLALIFFLWALLHQRTVRGPRRKSIKPARTVRMPRLPRQRSYRVRKPKAVTQARGRRSTRTMAVAPVLLAGVLVLGGCSSELWPGADDLPAASAIPSASPEVEVDEPTPAAATVSQVRAIVQDVAEVATASDASLDVEALKARFDGPALAFRTGNYAVRAKDSAFPAPAPIPSEQPQVSLPQVTGETWPRTMFAVVQASEATTAPVALTLVQQAPRDQYKVIYAVALEPDATIPDMAPEGVGALPLGPDSPLLSTPPSQLLAAYIDVLDTGEASASYGLFDVASDSLIPQLVKIRDDQKAKLGTGATIEVANAAGDADAIALSSQEIGALVNVYLTSTTTVKPVEAGSRIDVEGAVKTVTGLSGTTKGVTSSFGDQLLFYIPPIGSTDKIVLLGFTDGFLTAQELP